MCYGVILLHVISSEQDANINKLQYNQHWNSRQAKCIISDLAVRHVQLII